MTSDHGLHSLTMSGNWDTTVVRHALPHICRIDIHANLPFQYGRFAVDLSGACY